MYQPNPLTRRSSVPLAQIHRRDTAAVVRRGMRDQGSGWRGPDAGEMDDVGRGDHAQEDVETRGSGIGGDFQRRSYVEAARGPAWALIGQAYVVIVDR